MSSMKQHLALKLAFGTIEALEYQMAVGMAGAKNAFKIDDSHLCHHRIWCMGPFCVVYETHGFNMMRKADVHHTRRPDFSIALA